jgi:predicted nucleic acid-binding protein
MRHSTKSEPLFIDTWGWLVLANDKDPHHRFAVILRTEAAKTNQRWVTTDYVLDETITRLFASTPFPKAARFVEGIMEAHRLGSLLIERVDAGCFDRAWKLRRQLKDKPRISFTNLTSFTVMREHRIRQVLTADTHFAQVGLGFQTLPEPPRRVRY